MNLSPKDQTEHVELKGPDTLQAIREALLINRRAKELAAQPDLCSGDTAQAKREELDHLTDPPGRPAESNCEELHGAPSITGNNEPVWEELNHASSPTTTPADSTGEEMQNVPSSLVLEPPIDLSSRLTRLRDAKWNGDGISGAEVFLPPVEPGRDPIAESITRDQKFNGRQPFARRIFRIVGGLALMGIIVVVTPLRPKVATDLAPGPSVAEPTADTASRPGGPTQRQSGTAPRASDEMATTITIPQTEVNTMVNDFAAMRRRVEELATKQDQMGEAIP
jgi:hypothetical protein